MMGPFEKQPQRSLKIVVIVSAGGGAQGQGVGGPQIIAANLLEDTGQQWDVEVWYNGDCHPRLANVAACRREFAYRNSLSFGCLFRFVRWINESQPDVILTTGPVPLDCFVSIVAWGRSRVIVHRHISVSDLGLGRLKRSAFRAFDWVTSRLACQFIFSTPASQECTESDCGGYPRHSDVLFNGVDMGLFQPRSETHCGPVRIGMAAQFTKVKGWPVFLEALDSLLKEGFEIQGECFGQGPLMNETKALVMGHGETGKIRFHGNVLHMSKVLPDLDIFVLSSYREGLSQACVEAMACGLPLVLTDVAGSEVLVEEGINGFVVPSGSVTCLVASLKRLIQSSSLRREMGGNSRRRAEQQFDSKRISRSFAEVVNRVIGGNRE